MLKVEGHADLYRDETTGAIVSIGSEYNKYMKSRMLRKNKEQQKDSEIQELKSEVADLKQMVMHLLEKINEK